jgi:hypothetical protein
LCSPFVLGRDHALLRLFSAPYKYFLHKILLCDKINVAFPKPMRTEPHSETLWGAIKTCTARPCILRVKVSFISETKTAERPLAKLPEICFGASASREWWGPDRKRVLRTPHQITI